MRHRFHCRRIVHLERIILRIVIQVFSADMHAILVRKEVKFSVKHSRGLTIT